MNKYVGLHVETLRILFHRARADYYDRRRIDPASAGRAWIKALNLAEAFNLAQAEQDKKRSRP